MPEAGHLQPIDLLQPPDSQADYKPLHDFSITHFGFLWLAHYVVRMDTNINRAIGKGLKDTRQQKHLTQKQVANRMGRMQSYVSKTEQGERALRVAEVYEYAEALDLDWQDLMVNVKVWMAQYKEGKGGQKSANPEETDK